MPLASGDETVLFLISCVRNTSDGKTNWKAVCEERGIVSTQAAAKRWSRLSDANPAGAVSAAGGGAKAPKEKVSKEDKPSKEKKPPREKKAGVSPRKKRRTAKGEEKGEGKELLPASQDTGTGSGSSAGDEDGGGVKEGGVGSNGMATEVPREGGSE